MIDYIYMLQSFKYLDIFFISHFSLYFFSSHPSILPFYFYNSYFPSLLFPVHLPSYYSSSTLTQFSSTCSFVLPPPLYHIVYFFPFPSMCPPYLLPLYFNDSYFPSLLSAIHFSHLPLLHSSILPLYFNDSFSPVPYPFLSLSIPLCLTSFFSVSSEQCPHVVFPPPVIGRGGEQITRLQRESGAKIQMAQDSGGMPDRVCTVSGPRFVCVR